MGHWPAYVDDLLSNERWHKQEWLQFHHEHVEVPIIACALYLLFLVIGPRMFEKPVQVKGLLVAWNGLLAVFSIFGAYFMVPSLWKKVENDGFSASVCDHHDWYYNGPMGFCVTLFIYSKFFELMDTVFLIIRKKDVILLHWYHHVTVLLFCWHSLETRGAPGAWFATMNYFVHSIMYTYFALAIYGWKPIFKLALFITLLQVIQMVIGLVVLAYAIEQKYFANKPCYVTDLNLYFGLFIYVSYFILFGEFFYQKYCASKSKEKQK